VTWEGRDGWRHGDDPRKMRKRGGVCQPGDVGFARGGVGGMQEASPSNGVAGRWRVRVGEWHGFVHFWSIL